MCCLYQSVVEHLEFTLRCCCEHSWRAYEGLSVFWVERLGVVVQRGVSFGVVWT